MNSPVRFNPFPGLRSFEPDEDHLFFGRERQVDDLLGRLRRTRFLAVVGGSGSGKSSLVRSGLMPSLCGGYMVKAGSSWRLALMRPGANPIANLAAALNNPAVLGGASTQEALGGAMLDAALRRSGQGLVNVALQARLPPDENVLVVVDQFEELFRFKQATAEAGGRDEAVAFVKLLLEAARQNDVPIYVVLTMRSEFIGSCAEFPGLAEAVNDGQYLVPRMTRDELRLAITGPVAVGGGEIAPRLVTRVLNEIGDDPDQLPVLQHALMRTWDQWAAHRAGLGPIDFEDYEAIGTMKNALSQHADEAYDQIPGERGRHLAEIVFKALTEVTGQGLGVRRPCRVQELCDIGEASVDEIAAVIDQFRASGRSFIVPSVATPIHPQTIVDLSHESLMRLWTRLVRWTQQEARSAEIYHRLSNAALLHARNEAGLWRDPELQLSLNWREAQQPTAAWARRYDPEFGRATEFLAASATARDADAAVRETEAAARRLQERRVRRQTYALFGVSVVGLVLIGIILTIASRSRAEALRALALAKTEAAASLKSAQDEANRDLAGAAARLKDVSAQVAQADGLRALAMADASKNKDKATASLLATTTSEEFHENSDAVGMTALLAIEALRLDPSSGLARHTLMDVVQLLPPAPEIPARQGHVGRVEKMVVDPTGRLMVTSGEDGKLILWDFATRKIRRTIAEAVKSVDDLTMSWDGQWVAVAGDSTIRVWETETGRLVKQFPLENPRMLAFSPDRMRLAITTTGGGYKRFMTADWRESTEGATSAPVRSVQFMPKGEEVLETATGIRLASEQTEAPDTAGCRSAQIDAEGTVVARCPEGYVSFRLERGSLVREAKLRMPLDHPEMWVNALSETQLAPRLYVGRTNSKAHASDAYQVTVFDTDGVEYLRLPRPIDMVAVPSRGEWIASSDARGTVMFWRLAHGMSRPLPYEGNVVDLTFTHDERLLAVTEGEGAVRVFDAATGRQVAFVQLPLATGGILKYPRFSPDDSLLAIVGNDDMRFIRTADWKLLPERTIKAANGRADPLSLFFTPEIGSLLVAEKGVVRRFSVNPWAALSSFEAHREGVIYVSPDRRWIAGVEPGGNVDTRKYVFRNADSGQITSPDMIPGLRGLAPQKATRTDVAAALRGKNWVGLPDDQNKLSGDAEGGTWWKINLDDAFGSVIVIRDILTGNKVAGLVHDSRVRAVAISRDGTWIATTSRDKKVFLWAWSQKGLIDLTCTLVSANLTPEEWKERHLQELGLGPHRLTCPSVPIVAKR